MKEFKIEKRKTRAVKVGNLTIGGNAPVVIQSMTNTDTRDVSATVEQILRLEEAGCELVRVAVPDETASIALEKIKAKIHIPLVADIHFNYELALRSMDYGADKIRINPGNIGGIDRVEKVVQKAKECKIAIRMGVNSGSLEKDLIQKYNGVTPEGIIESAFRNVKLLEEFDFEDIVVSLKSSSVPLAIKSYEAFSKQSNYPLHIGITEAGTIWAGTIKSCVGVGSLLSQGIGDTIRISLAGDPVEEIKVAKQVLKSLGLRKGIDLIACPTCGRTEIDLIGIANQVQERIQDLDLPISVAVMGCVVNGPGEAKEADIGIAGGKGVGLIFRKGTVVRKVKENELVNALFEELETIVKEHRV